MACAPSEDSDQPGHPPSLIRVFAVRMKKAWVLNYPLSAQRRLIRLGRCLGWSESSLGAQSLCWFCHEPLKFAWPYYCLIENMHLSKPVNSYQPISWPTGYTCILSDINLAQIIYLSPRFLGIKHIFYWNESPNVSFVLAGWQNLNFLRTRGICYV